MTTLYYFREDGSLIGGFVGSVPAEDAAGNTEIAPLDARQKWSGSAWTPDPAALPSLLPVITYKADIWRRCTEAEAEALDAAMQSADAKLRGIWTSSTYIDHADDLFTTLREFIKAALASADYARADELLAPSE